MEGEGTQSRPLACEVGTCIEGTGQGWVVEKVNLKQGLEKGEGGR